MKWKNIDVWSFSQAKKKERKRKKEEEMKELFQWISKFQSILEDNRESSGIDLIYYTCRHVGLIFLKFNLDSFLELFWNKSGSKWLEDQRNFMSKL